MSEKIATLIKVREESLRCEIQESLLADQLLAFLSNDPHSAKEFITVTDDPDYNILENELVILTGQTENKGFFAQVNTNCTDISRAVKRGYFHWETVNMNRAACQSVQTHRDSLEEIAYELSFTAKHKKQLREIKMSLSDLLPVGVIVIEAEGEIIYANEEFHKLFQGSHIRPLGKRYTTVLPDPVVQLLTRSDKNTCLTIINGNEVSVRKAPLISASKDKGFVLVFTEV